MFSFTGKENLGTAALRVGKVGEQEVKISN